MYPFELTPRARRVFAFVSACGIAISVVGYIDSFSAAGLGTTSRLWIFTFSGARMDTMLRWWILLIPGFTIMALPIFLLEYPASKKWGWSWKILRRDMPTWVAPCVVALQLLAAVHFIWLAAHLGAGVPAVRDGQYVLQTHGKILAVLAEPEYIRLQSAVARTAATITTVMYSLPMFYWWFNRDRRETP